MHLREGALTPTAPAESRDVLDPVSAVAQWRRGQVDRAAAGRTDHGTGDRFHAVDCGGAFIGEAYRAAHTAHVNLAAALADAVIHEAYRAARAAHADLAAALVHERRTAVAVMRALGQVHDVADEPVELDDALAAHLTARLDTRRILREVLIRDYDCTGCGAIEGEECGANCMPSPRNAPDAPTPAEPPATVHLVHRTDQLPGDGWDAFVYEVDARMFADAAGIAAPVLSTRVVSHYAALSLIAATRPDPPRD